MKAEINNENKVRFFALYWGQKVFQNPILSDKPVSNIWVFEFDDPEDIKEEILLLKSLSQISDDDSSVIRVEKSKNSFITVFEVDYLRSKSYALPWMGLSVEEMIEAGWIKLTES